MPGPRSIVSNEAFATRCVVPIALGDRSYDIMIGEQLLADPRSYEGIAQGTAAVLVSNATVLGLHGAGVRSALESRFPRLLVVELPDGEAHKNWVSLDMIFDRLLAEGCDRKTVIFALGGGVVGDVAGFAAACYLRGVPFVQLPTTLLAQVDSSVGGKTAINHPRGKNMVGAFYQPERVLCDLSVIDTLPARELSAGLAEVIKYGPIADAQFLEWIESHLEQLLARERAALAHAVQRSCEIKAAVVAADERETGLRAILNFGHTFGHAIEAGLGYGQWLHGEAVGCGMVMASDLSVRLGLMPAGFVDRMHALCQRAGLPVRAPALGGADHWLDLMRVDKKTEGGALRFVVIEAIGRASLRAVPEALVRETLAAHCD
jgi:3-dehydroquinate synthase